MVFTLLTEEVLVLALSKCLAIKLQNLNLHKSRLPNVKNATTQAAKKSGAVCSGSILISHL